MSDNLISIIVPVYNAERWLARCVESVLAQSYTEWELLLIDDGSTDGSAALCDELAAQDSRIRALHKENGGPSMARNLGLDKAKGEWACFMDADDFVDKAWLATFARKMKECDMVVSGFYYVDPSLVGRLTDLKDGTMTSSEALEMLNETGILGFVWCKCFRMSVIREQGLCFNPDIRVREDEEFVCHYLAYAKKVAVDSRCTYHYFFPDFAKKYASWDGFYPFAMMLHWTSSFVTDKQSPTMRQQMSGLFRWMLHSYKHGEYAEGRKRLEYVATLEARIRGYHRWARWLTRWNLPFFHPLLAVYGLCYRKCRLS